MNEFRNKSMAHQQADARRVEIDEGLRSFMLGVYNYMALGVAVTAVVTLFMANNPAIMQAVALGPMKWVLFIGVLGLGWFAPKLVFSANAVVAHGAFWLYATLWGLLISPMVTLYLSVNSGIVVQALAITALTFGGASLAGHVTKRDLSGLSGFFMIATIGLLIAILLNAFIFQSGLFSLITSCLVVLVFAGLTAYETQMIKSMYYEGDAEGLRRGKSIFGAFMLYGSFVTMFIHILNILGIMNNE